MVDFSGLFNGAKKAITDAATPPSETQEMIDKVTRAAENAQAKAKEMTDALMAKLGVKSPSLLTGSAEEIADQPSAGLKAGATKQVERSAAMAEYTAGIYGEKQAVQTTHWRDKFSRGQEIAAETTASPAGALPPG